MNSRTRWQILIPTFLAVAILIAPSARAEDEVEPSLDPASVMDAFDEIQTEEFGDIVVTATRGAAAEFDVPRSMNLVKERRLRELGVTSPLDGLQSDVGIWLEKRTSHASDPVIRGLAGGNLLTLVDGNTLSTFWGEGGFHADDMYGKIDPEFVERIEVVRGPSSVLYGSNALGAVLNVITKESPFDYTTCGTLWGGRSYVQANTAPSGWRFRQEGYGATRNLRWFAGVTYIDYGTTRVGGGRELTPTAARGYYADVAVNWKISELVHAKLTVQYTDLDPLYRWYRPTQDNTNKRVAIAGTVEFLDLRRTTGLADRAKITLFYQDKEDGRRWFDATTKAVLRTGVAKWRTIQAEAQAEKQLACHALTYGIEFESTDGESPDDEQFTMTFPDGTVRKDAPDSLWSSLGAYVQDVWKVNSSLSLTGSLRFDVFRFETTIDSTYVPAGVLDPSVDEFTDWETALVGGLQATYALGRSTHAYGGWTRGFRQFAPRFGATQHAWGVVVPNELLDPVTADQLELGVKHESRWVQAELVGYYTWFNNFQNVVPGTFQGQDWFDWNNNAVRDPDEAVYTYVGNGKAYVYGFEASLDVNLAALDQCFFGDAWTVSTGFMWNYGQDTTNDIPIRHTHPMAGLVRVRWEPTRARMRPWAEFEGRLADRYDRIPPDRLANDLGYLEDPQDATQGMRRTWGLPGYSVWDLRCGFSPCQNIDVTLGVTNIFDKLYRPAHARMDSPGRGFFAGVSVKY